MIPPQSYSTHSGPGSRDARRCTHVIRDIGGLCGFKGMIRVCLNIDSDPGRKGQVLSVTDPTSDLTLEYKTKFVSQNDVANYASEMKVEYQNPDLRFISPAFFGAILTDVSKITVCANAPIVRYPSGCSYEVGKAVKGGQEAVKVLKTF